MLQPGPAPVELCLFGAPRLRRGDAALHVGARKALALLAVLALEGEQPRDRLAALLWPDVDAAAARRNLRRELFRLRELGCAPAETRADRLALPETLAVDLRRFRHALQDGDDAAALDAAGPGLCDGLDGLASPELDSLLERARSTVLRAREAARQRRAQALEATGQPAAALVLHLQALAEDPCAEAAARPAMRLLAAAGDRAGALALYRRLAQFLRAELDLAPDPATEALASGLRRDADPARPTAAAPVAVPARAAPTLLADRLPFVGRSALRARIDAAWAAGKRVYLSGVPGAGKTRLATECAAAHGAWLRVPCHPHDVQQPYAWAVRALRALRDAAPDVELPDWARRELAALLPELGPAPLALASSEAAERLAAACACAWRLLVHDNFNVLVLDDWQWCDDASRALCKRLDDGDPALSWLVAYRSAQLPLAALHQVRQDVDGARAQLLTLEGLDSDEALALIQALSASHGGALFARRLQQATDGNPFFLIETLRHLFEQGQVRVDADGGWSTAFDAVTTDYAELPVPPGVRDTVLARVRALGEPARRLLEAASLVGGGFDLALLDGVTPLPQGAALDLLEHAQAARLISADAAGYRFAHDLVRQCLADSLSPARRRLLHERLAQRLQAAGAAPALVALQYEQAGRPAAAWPWRQRAGEQAWRLHALAEARAQFEQALVDGASGNAAVELHLALARLHRRQADAAAATAALAAALQAAPQADARVRLDARLACVEDRIGSERAEEGLALLDAMGADLAQAPPARRARALALRSVALSGAGQDAQSTALEREAIELLEGVPDAIGQQAVLLDDAARAALQRGDMADAEALVRRAIVDFEACDDVGGLAQATVLLGVVLLHGHHDRAGAQAALERARALAAGCGHVPAQRGAILNLVKLHTDLGHADAALALLQEGEALAPGFEHPRAEQAFMQARYFVHYLRGEVAAAAAAADRLLAQARRVQSRRILVESLQMVVDLFLHTADLDHARALLDEADEVLGQCDSASRQAMHPLVMAKRAWCRLAGGDADGARLELARRAPVARQEDRWVLAWVGAAIALALRDLPEARRWLADVDIERDSATDALAMLLVQRLALAAAEGRADAAAQRRAAALLQAGCVPALEARALRAALGRGGLT